MADTETNTSDLNYADALWKSADTLRGQVDAAEYKHVVLGLLFLKYISDSFESRRDDLQAELMKDGIKDEQLERLLESRRELVATLEKRADRIEQAKNNLALVASEQERLDQQIKLIRADSIATKNATALSARLDATVANLEATNQWLSQMDQFRDILTDMPQSGVRVGFGAPSSAPPPLPQKGKEKA